MEADTFEEDFSRDALFPTMYSHTALDPQANKKANLRHLKLIEETIGGMVRLEEGIIANQKALDDLLGRTKRPMTEIEFEAGRKQFQVLGEADKINRREKQTLTTKLKETEQFLKTNIKEEIDRQTEVTNEIDNVYRLAEKYKTNRIALQEMFDALQTLKLYGAPNFSEGRESHLRGIVAMVFELMSTAAPREIYAIYDKEEEKVLRPLLQNRNVIPVHYRTFPPVSWKNMQAARYRYIDPCLVILFAIQKSTFLENIHSFVDIVVELKDHIKQPKAFLFVHLYQVMPPDDAKNQFNRMVGQEVEQIIGTYNTKITKLFPGAGEPEEQLIARLLVDADKLNAELDRFIVDCGGAPAAVVTVVEEPKVPLVTIVTPEMEEERRQRTEQEQKAREEAEQTRQREETEREERVRRELREGEERRLKQEQEEKERAAAEQQRQAAEEQERKLREEREATEKILTDFENARRAEVDAVAPQLRLASMQENITAIETDVLANNIDTVEFNSSQYRLGLFVEKLKGTVDEITTATGQQMKILEDKFLALESPPPPK